MSAGLIGGRLIKTGTITASAVGFVVIVAVLQLFVLYVPRIAKVIARRGAGR